MAVIPDDGAFSYGAKGGTVGIGRQAARQLVAESKYVVTIGENDWTNGKYQIPFNVHGIRNPETEVYVQDSKDSSLYRRVLVEEIEVDDNHTVTVIIDPGAHFAGRIKLK